MKDIRPSVAKSPSDLALEWDHLAEERHRQIASGTDLSFVHVLVPTMLKLFDGADPTVVLDIGSGTGHFTAQLARLATKVIGIEPSHLSLTMAKANCRDAQNVQFIQASIEEAASTLHEGSATAATACMTLMTAPDLEGFVRALSLLLAPGAKFVATLTHPCFWPRYWGYDLSEWFNYLNETFIEAPFVISKAQTDLRTTHIHRPLEQYTRIFIDAGFSLEAILEPIPVVEVQALYPQPWLFPRFIGMRWAKSF